MILCIGLAADETFCHTLAALKRAGADFVALDVAQLVYAGEVRFLPGYFERSSISLHETRIVLSQCESAWVRLVDIAPGAPNDKLRQRAAALFHVLATSFTDCPIRVMNPPLRDYANFAKLYHAAALAPIGGWSLPRSCLTNDPSRARAFIASCPDGVIFKGASSAKTWVTLYDPKRHAERLRLLQSCPVLFQERIGGPDVRVHVVGDRIFAELIESRAPDYRTSRANTYSSLVPPQTVADGCIALSRFMGVPLLGIDFRIDERSGTWFFLEANALPCYEAYDRRAGGAISAAVVEWLLGGRMTTEAAANMHGGSAHGRGLVP